MKRGLLRLLLAGSVVVGTPLACLLPLHAAIAATLTVPSEIATDIADARLAGAGTFRYFGLHIYDARFWVGAGGYRASAVRAEKFALELRYARALAGIKIAERSADEMKKLGLGSSAQRADWLARMEKIFPDVQEGSRITGVYLPAQGARFYRDGKPIGEVADPEFAHAFFAIWLDPRTTGGPLREALLSEAAPR